MKNINYAGILLIILGFSAPYLTNGFNPSIIFFWVGLLLLMNENEKHGKWNTALKYGKLGLLLNIILSLLLLIIFDSSLLQNQKFYTLAYYITNPISVLVDKIIPQQMTELPDGSLLVTISYIRSTLTKFLNLLFFVATGVLVGKYIKVITGSGLTF